MKRLDVSLDLETLGTQSNAAIVAIGAVSVYWDAPDNIPVIFDVFYETVDLQSSVAHGGTIDAKTVIWWMGQGDLARKQIFLGDTPLPTALQNFACWQQKQVVNSDEVVQLWGNGADFDNAVLTSAYKNCKIAQPWAFRQNSCYRTLKKLYPEIKFVKPEVEHDAQQDAIAQGLHLAHILKTMGVY
jgi:hypothetical protein